jgi:hypothetical protein
VAASLPTDAMAQPRPADKALATELFNSGRALLTKGHLAEACAQLERSQSLDPATGTLLNLAVCHEMIGRTASAWAEFQDARILAQRDGRDDRVALADDHIRDLEGKLCRLNVLVAPEAAKGDAQVRRDGVFLPREAWGVALPIDPGAHDVELSAHGKPVWRTRVDVTESTCLQSVTISASTTASPPPSSDDHPSPVAAPVLAPGGKGSSATERLEALPARPLSASERAIRGDSGRILAGVIVSGAGLVTIGVASVFGVAAFEKRHASDGECPENRCSALGVSLNDTAKLDADLSTAGFSIGLAAIAAGTGLWLSGRASPRPTPTIAWSPIVSSRQAALRVLVTF